MVFAGPELAEPITALEHVDALVVALSGDEIHLFDRGRLISARYHKQIRRALGFKVLGEHLVILTESSLELLAFPACHHLGTVAFGGEARATCMVHPLSYVNKILVGFDDGHLELWNIQSRKLIYSFGTQGAPVRCLSGSNVCDIVVMGLEDGTARILDVKNDSCVLSLAHSKAVTSVSFGSGPMMDHLLAVALADGRAVLWNLEDRQIVDTWTAHQIGPISLLQFVPSLAVMLSTANDNTIAEWVIEGSSVRLLRSRRGHAKPVSLVRFIGPEGESILSCGEDRSLRLASMVKDSQSSEVSQGAMEHFANKANLSREEISLEPVIAVDFARIRDVRWDNMLTAHLKSCVARTWRHDLRRLGSHELRSVSGASILSVCVSSCGNYGVVGCEDGSVDIFNMQSGLHRRHIPVGGALASSPLVGVGLEASNQYLVCAHANGTLRMVNFQSGEPCVQLSMEGAISKTCFDPEGGLMAIALEGSLISVFDCHSGAVVRKFAVGEGGNVATDLVFSEDGKWLISSGTDKHIRILDMLSGLEIDSFVVENVPLSLSLSPNLEFLAVAVKGDVAVRVWSNRSLYHPITLRLVKQSESLSMEASRAEANSDLLKLSAGPRFKSLNLVNIESIKSRNTPIVEVKDEKPMPFFLDALKTAGPAKRNPEGNAVVDPAASNPDAASPGTDHQGTLSERLAQSPEAALDWLLSMSVATIDLELKCLSLSDLAHRHQLVEQFLTVLLGRIKSFKDYDLCVAVLQVFIKSLSADIRSRPAEHLELLVRAREALDSSWRQGEKFLQKSLCLASFSRLL